MKRLRLAIAAAALLATPAFAEWADERKVFEDQYASEDAAARVRAVQALHNFDHPDGMAMLLEKYATERDTDVRHALADAMNAVTNVRARDVFRDTILKHPDAEARARYCALFADGRMLDRFEMLRLLFKDPSELVRARALRNLGPSDDALAGAASKLLDDPVADVRMAACSAAASIKSTEPVPLLIRRLENEKLAEIRWAAGDALSKISGQEYGEDVASWKKWWQEKVAARMTPVEKALWNGGQWLKPRCRRLLDGYKGIVPPGGAADDPNRILNVRAITLVIYAMFHAGIAVDDPDLKDGIEFLETFPLTQTYDVSIAAMALADIDPRAHRERLAEIAQWLVDQQCANGQWSYGVFGALPARTKKPEKKTSTPGGAAPAEGEEEAKIAIRQKQAQPRLPGGDNSNTQYALLGLRACLAACDIPKPVWQLSLAWFRKCQNGDGSWAYGMGGDRMSGYGSMTAGGVSSVAVCMRALGLHDELQPDKLKSQNEIHRAMEWLGANFAVDRNPVVGGWHYYWLYGLERAGMILGVAEFGKHDWYKEGSDLLLKAQKEDGSWKGDQGGDEEDGTCFAILFLRKATKGYTETGGGGGKK